MRIIKLHLNKDGYTWDVVPQEAREFYWEEFQDAKKRQEAAMRVSRDMGELAEGLGGSYVTYLHEIDAVRLAVTEQDLPNT
ncbi:hypothetical protein JCGZ_19720 [Jatropha curcas]|uniref:Uncharacterized protein n=1 Tax=Jatropha curcas TaxID=180498 RepID=A0A067JUP1_JATCU|nr:hypothetical protein JCGZ_19720 [Jatropha curcas]